MNSLRSNRSTGAGAGQGGWGHYTAPAGSGAVAVPAWAEDVGPQPVSWQRCQIKLFVGLRCKT